MAVLEFKSILFHTQPHGGLYIVVFSMNLLIKLFAIQPMGPNRDGFLCMSGGESD